MLIYLLLLIIHMNVYQKIKKKFNHDQEIARNIFLNLDNQSNSIPILKCKI